nr:MAG TPA: hypothetical protein [Caudoviricetes sp.]
MGHQWYPVVNIPYFIQLHKEPLREYSRRLIGRGVLEPNYLI